MLRRVVPKRFQPPTAHHPPEFREPFPLFLEGKNLTPKFPNLAAQPLDGLQDFFLGHGNSSVSLSVSVSVKKNLKLTLTPSLTLVS